ncbi:MAG TPA: I78 family peptidase inhibitor [Burkholderiaceae bacterium]|nr:I78 family peptidase inhibitor [Burkholderiaceae bacterium]
MKISTLTSVLFLSGLLAACGSTVDLDAPRTPSSSSTTGGFLSDSEYRCDAEPAQTLRGQTYSDAIAEQARSLSGSRVVRTLRPGQVITMEYNPERINLRLDNRDVIESLGCG